VAKKAKVQETLEVLSAQDTLRAIKFAQVVVLLMDATSPYDKQDLQIASLCEREGRALVVGVSKWDLVQNKIDWSAKVKTSELNDWLREKVQRHPPPAVNGRRIKPKYISQTKTRPPTFVLKCSRATKLPESYRRYLINGLREDFDLKGVPIRMFVKADENPYDRTVRKQGFVIRHGFRQRFALCRNDMAVSLAAPISLIASLVLQINLLSTSNRVD